ncbi:MAG: hypothetical protein CHACPFDD_04037 [Phycisphaerae bacterium]|nr:hypothetical protein [Phycisphaerae bacterium]
MLNVIHVTHEAVHKMGGIGTVLEGLINSRPCRDSIARTVLVCPMFEPTSVEPLGAGGKVEYSSYHRIESSPYDDAFRRVEQNFHVHIVYGRRPIEDHLSQRRTLCEVLLIDIRTVNAERVNRLKGRLWELHGLQSYRHEQVWDFEQYVRLAAPAVAALEAMHLASDTQPAVVFAHEFMGVPTALALAAERPRAYRTLFHAHEVATIRRIVEEHPGHDLMFYNVLKLAREARVRLSDVFGPQHDYFKHAIVETASDCDAILAVGHHVLDEVRFLGPEFDQADATIAYNGIPARRITLAERRESRALLDEYCHTLLGWRPDLVLTHATRMTRSKALWRDLDILEYLDEHLAADGRRAVYFLVSTELPRRPIEDILRAEREWDWPLLHRDGHPDLTEGEARYWRQMQRFNMRARNIRAILVNQFGFDQATCGLRMPARMHVSDLRRGTDVELGLSLYEPFGISPLEPLTFGGLCVASTSCGCTGFLDEVAPGRNLRNVLLVDYTNPPSAPRTIPDALAVDEAERRAAEREIARAVAAQILPRLPRGEAEEIEFLEAGYQAARLMSWDHVAERFIFPAIQRALSRRRILTLAG